MIIKDYTTYQEVLELKDLLKKKNDKFAAIVGAGSSLILGIRGWEEMLEEMQKKFNSNFNLTDEIYKNGYPKTAQKIFEYANNNLLYNDFMRDSMKSSIASSYDLQKKLLSKFKIIMTTNFDNAFEECYIDTLEDLDLNGIVIDNVKLKPCCLPDLDFSDINKYYKWLVYLHGNSEKNIYVFKNDEYEIFYRKSYGGNENSTLEDFLKNVFTRLNLIFVGFSFSDLCFINHYKLCLIEENNRQLREKTFSSKYLHPDFPKHFIFLHEDELKDYIPESLKNKFNDNSIWYKLFKNNQGGFEPVYDFLNELSNLKLTIEKDVFLKKIYYQFNSNLQRIALFQEINFNDNIKIIKVSDYRELQFILDFLTLEKRQQLKNAGIIK